MKGMIVQWLLSFLVSCLLSGCGPNAGVAIINTAKRPDTDVTILQEYNFNSFSGTHWKTKAKTALAEIKTYSGEHIITLLAPDNFDPKHPNYRPPAHLIKVIAELPIGTHLRIERLMKDNGNWGGVRVTGSLDDGKIVYLSNYLLAKNCFIWKGWSESNEWGVDPEMLEKAEK